MAKVKRRYKLRQLYSTRLPRPAAQPQVGSLPRRHSQGREGSLARRRWAAAAPARASQTLAAAAARSCRWQGAALRARVGSSMRQTGTFAHVTAAPQRETLGVASPPPQACAVHPPTHHSGITQGSQASGQQKRIRMITAQRPREDGTASALVQQQLQGTLQPVADRRAAPTECCARLPLKTRPAPLGCTAPTCDQPRRRQTITHAAAGPWLVELIAKQNLAGLRRCLRMGCPAAAMLKHGRELGGCWL